MAKATKTQVVKFIRKGDKGDKGDPAVNIIVSSEFVVFTKQGQSAIVSVEVYIGEQQLTYGDGTNDTFLCGALGTSSYLFDDSVYWGFRVENDNKTFKYLLKLEQKADLSENVPFTVKVNGITYNKSITFKTVYDGVDGTDGENGISVMLSQDNIVHKKSEYKANYQLQINVLNGTDKVLATTFNIEYVKTPENVTLEGGYVDDYTHGLDISIAAQAEVNANIEIEIDYNNNTYAKSIPVTTVQDGTDGEKGERGASLRGPQGWNEVGTGYQFYCGAEGEPYLDVVVYNKNYYLCKKSHTKTTSNYPTSSVDSTRGYWQLGDKIDLVATYLVLAKYALINNLGVKYLELKTSDGFIRMTDDEGNILFNVENGNVTCLTGTFENVDVSGIVHASLMYSSVKSFIEQYAGSSTYNIDPINDPTNTFYIVVATGHTKFINLPDANTYAGLELNFYQAVFTHAGMGDIYVAATNSQYIYYNTVGRIIEGNVVSAKLSIVARDTRIRISANEVVRLKAMNGSWYVMTGLVTEE